MRIRIALFAVLALLVSPALADGPAPCEIGDCATLDPCFGAIIAAIVVILMLATVIEWSNRHDG